MIRRPRRRRLVLSCLFHFLPECVLACLRACWAPERSQNKTQRNKKRHATIPTQGTHRMSQNATALLRAESLEPDPRITAQHFRSSARLLSAS